jgi:hypothetical protein
MTEGGSVVLITRMPAQYWRYFPWKLDRRLLSTQELASDLYALWVALGGVEKLSPQRRWLAERIVMKRRQLIEYETAVAYNRARGQDEPPMPLSMTEGESQNAASTVQGHLKTLGLDVIPPSVRSLRQVMDGPSGGAGAAA